MLRKRRNLKIFSAFAWRGVRELGPDLQEVAVPPVVAVASDLDVDVVDGGAEGVAEVDLALTGVVGEALELICKKIS